MAAVANANVPVASPSNSSRFKTLKMILRFIWIVVDNVIAIFVYAALMFMLYGFRLIWPVFYWEFDSWLFREMLRTIGYWTWSAGYDVVEYGDSPFLYQDERCLVIVNHQGYGDVPLMCTTIAKKGVGGGKVMWVLDSGFKYTNFGIVTKIRRDFFITQGRDTRQEQLKTLSDHIRRYYWSRDRRWFVIFPEGGFLHKRRESSQNYGRKHGFPILTHCTLPRIGGVKWILDTTNPVPQIPVIGAENVELNAQGQEVQNQVPPPPLVPPPGPGFRYLVDVTMGYPTPRPLDLWHIVLGNHPKCEISIHYRRIPIEDVPNQNEDALRDFLYALWVEKERKLAHYHRHGHFPGCPRRDGVLVDYHTADRIAFVFRDVGHSLIAKKVAYT